MKRKPHLREILVVEGRYDKNTLSQIVDATVIELGGFGIFHDKQKLSLLRRLAIQRGIVILTDSDGAGFVIRNHLKSAISQGNVYHAYIPDVYGKERRKRIGGKEGKIGVEGMRPEILLDALHRSGAHFEEDSAIKEKQKTPITRADFMDLGLIGAGSTVRRKILLKKLSLPEHLSVGALLELVNLLMTREEFKKLDWEKV